MLAAVMVQHLLVQLCQPQQPTPVMAAQAGLVAAVAMVEVVL